MRASLLTSLLTGLLVVAGCSATAAPPPDASPTPAAPVARPVGLDIPAIDVRVDALTDLGLNAAGNMDVPADAVTTGWYAPGPAPGEPGPAVLAAHVNYNGVPGTFARLHELDPGDEVTVARADGSTARFVIDRVETYPKARFPTQTVYGNAAGPELRLITCGGAFDPAVRSYESNVVAFARFVA